MAIPQGLLSRKTQRSLGAVVNEAAADVSCEFGRRMLAKFGWEEGKGLGKREDGMTSHILVKQRSEYLGLGAATETTKTAWAPPSEMLTSDASKSKKIKKIKTKKGKATGDATTNMFGVKPVGSGIIPGLDDAAIFELCGGARLGRRAHPGLQVGKEKRVQDADAEFMAKYGKASTVATSAPLISTKADAGQRNGVSEVREKKERKRCGSDSSLDDSGVSTLKKRKKGKEKEKAEEQVKPKKQRKERKGEAGPEKKEKEKKKSKESKDKRDRKDAKERGHKEVSSCATASPRRSPRLVALEMEKSKEVPKISL
eukprot:scaffold233717_cov30-Tisochrysis_lutea.AAC.1